MERLTTKDLRALLEFLKDCYGFCDLDAFAQRVISKLPKIVPSEIITYNEINPRRRRARMMWHPPTAQPSVERTTAFEQHIREHPLIMRHQKTRDDRAIKIADILTRSQFHRLGIYNEFFRPLSVEHQMAFCLPAPPDITIGIALNRTRRDFSDRERLCLNVLRPHLAQAYRNAEAVTQMQGQLALVRHTLEKLDQGVVVLTRDGRITLANAQAIQWLADYFGSRSLSGMRLPENLRRWVSHQETLLAAKDAVPPPQKPLVVERKAKRLVVRHQCESAQCVLLFDEQQTEYSPQALERFGLSRRESEVLIWVAQGKTNIEIGMILGLSPRTVQKHLERIYQKLGVENRTSAAAKAYEIAANSKA